jgi:hypothetical protein
VQDSQAPAISLVSPLGGEFIAGGANYPIRWTASDTNFGNGPIEIDYSADGGTTWSATPVTANHANDGTFQWPVPAVNIDSARIRVTATDRAGRATTVTSGSFTIDSIPPTFSARTIDPNTVRVTFTEPVSGGASSLEWTIGDVPAGGVQAAGGPITQLTLTTAPGHSLGGDDNPPITYQPLGVSGPTYADHAGNQIPPAARKVPAADGIVPATPTISQLNGKAVGAQSVSGGVRRPEVQVDNILQGETAVVFRESNGHAGWQDDDLQIGSAMAGPNGALVTPQDDLGPDGVYTLYAQSRDPSGNRSPGSNGVTYMLESVSPVPLYAITDGQSVTVKLSEPITGLDSPTQWSVSAGGPVTGVSGSGDTRVLSAQNVPAGEKLSYTPPPANAYQDSSGNPLAAFHNLLIGSDLPPGLTIATPTQKTYTNQPTFTIIGTSDGDTVQLFTDANNDGQPDAATPAQTSTVAADHTYSIAAALAPDAANDFLLRGVRTDKGITGPFADVPTIVQDSTAPTVTLTKPAGGEFIGGGQGFAITWNASDANFAGSPIDLDYSTDAGGTWTTISHGEANDGSFTWNVPGGLNTDQARVRVIATDLATNVTEKRSGLFSIDSVPPTFTARTLDPSHVGVTFSEPVSGTAASDEWTIAGVPAGGIEAAGGPITQLTLSTTGVQTIGGDDHPQIVYSPLGFLRVPYADRAGNQIPAPRSAVAADGIAPVVPSISQVAGRAVSGNQAVLGNDRTPDVLVTNILQGETAKIFVESGDAPGFTASDPQAGEAVAGANGATVTLSDLGGDATYTLYAIAEDASHNRSPGGGSARYSLDTVVPTAFFAVTDGQQVTVRFDEPVNGTNDKGQWQVSQGGPVTNVGGSGDARVLDANLVPAGATLTWTRPGTGGYADGAGNELATFTLQVLDAAPPIVHVNVPGQLVFTNASTFAVQGTSEGDTVQLFRDAGNDGSPDGGPVATSSVGPDGAYTLQAPLGANADNDFLVRAVKTDISLNGPFADVATIVQDGTPPTAAISTPAGGEDLAGGATFAITWTASDAHIKPGPITVQYASDGTHFVTVADNELNDGTYDWKVPVDNVTAAAVRIVATDRAGNTTTAVSQPFMVDSIVPTFAAVTAGATTIEVHFSEPVKGTVAADEWAVGGFPVQTATMAAGSGATFRDVELVLPSVAPIGRDDRPLVEYTPRNAPSRSVISDRAGNVVNARRVVATDGIAPGPPTLDAYDALVAVSELTLNGAADVGDGYKIVVRRTSPGDASFSAPVGANGRFSITFPLARNAANRLEITEEDAFRNASGAILARIDQDSAKPVFRFVRLHKRRTAQGFVVTIRWAAVDAHPDFARIWFRRPGGQRWHRITRHTAADRSFDWQVPDRLVGHRIKVKVALFDKLGHRGAGRSGFTRIGSPLRP